MDFVLDNSVVMRWLLLDASGQRQRYAEQVLASLADGQGAGVPSLWWLELANVIARAERKSLVLQSVSREFIDLMNRLSIQEFAVAGATLLGRILPLARQYGISSYDAAYLELAMQFQLPLATLDEPLRKAAAKVGVELYLA